MHMCDYPPAYVSHRPRPDLKYTCGPLRYGEQHYICLRPRCIDPLYGIDNVAGGEEDRYMGLVPLWLQPTDRPPSIIKALCPDCNSYLPHSGNAVNDESVPSHPLPSPGGPRSGSGTYSICFVDSSSCNAVTGRHGTSQTRREEARQGRYLPQSGTLRWDRGRLIAYHPIR